MSQPNLNYIEELSGGDAKVKSHLISIIRREVVQDILSYKNAVGRKDYGEIYHYVHKLKHKIGILGLNEGYALAIAYESSLKDNSLLHKDAFEKVLGDMSAFVEKLDHDDKLEDYNC